MSRLLSAIRRAWSRWITPCPECVRAKDKGKRMCDDCWAEEQI